MHKREQKSRKHQTFVTVSLNMPLNMLESSCNQPGFYYIQKCSFKSPQKSTFPVKEKYLCCATKLKPWYVLSVPNQNFFNNEWVFECCVAGSPSLIPYDAKHEDLFSIFRLSDQVQKQFEKTSGKFEDLSLGENRPTQLLRRFGNLYSQVHVYFSWV